MFLGMSGLAVDVPAQVESMRGQRRDPAVAEPLSFEPAGRGQIPLPDALTTPGLDLEAKDQMRAQYRPN